MRNKIIVIKIGSGVFVTKRRRVDEFRVCRIVDDIEVLYKKGVRIILVVSGAVAMGMRAFDTVSEGGLVKRCAAGVGQLMVVNEFYRRFLQKNICCAQVLLTKKNLEQGDSRRFLKDTLMLYLDHAIVPILNENDVIDLNSFGGNDELSLVIAHLLVASDLIILSSFVSYCGVGGAKSKMKVLEKARLLGITARIADGKKPWVHFLQN